MIDFSILENIDFTNTGNLLFLFIILVLVLIIFIVFIVIIAGIIKMVKRLVVKTFNLNVRKPKFDEKNGEDSLSQFKKENKINGPSIFPSPKNIVSQGSKNIKPASESFEEKSQKDVLGRLSKIKSGKQVAKETLESKMPPRTEESEDNEQQEIKIPVPKHSSVISDSEKNPVAAFDNIGSSVIKSDLGPQIEKNSAHENTDSSVFEGRSEISRIKLQGKMKRDAKVWQAERQSGLSLSPVERAKLVKEVFSPIYGTNISKTDLKSGIRKLNKKMLGLKNPLEHEKIRKEVKFLKKIGGIKQ